MIVGSDGSRYCRIMKDLHYEIDGHTGLIRDFYGKLYDNQKAIFRAVFLHSVRDTIPLKKRWRF